MHIKTLNLDQVLHVLASWILELSLHLLHGCHILISLLHLELHVVEDAIEVHGVELDWHFDRRVLLEVHQGLLALLWVHHARGSLDSLTFLHCDLFTIEDHELDQSLDHDHAIVWLACNRIVNQAQV